MDEIIGCMHVKSLSGNCEVRRGVIDDICDGGNEGMDELIFD